MQGQVPIVPGQQQGSEAASTAEQTPEHLQWQLNSQVNILTAAQREMMRVVLLPTQQNMPLYEYRLFLDYIRLLQSRLSDLREPIAALQRTVQELTVDSRMESGMDSAQQSRPPGSMPHTHGPPVVSSQPSTHPYWPQNGQEYGQQFGHPNEQQYGHQHWWNNGQQYGQPYQQGQGQQYWQQYGQPYWQQYGQQNPLLQGPLQYGPQ
jgi:hypothetical protein